MGAIREEKTTITKAEFYRLGGLSNRDLYRVKKGNRWTYWKSVNRY